MTRLIINDVNNSAFAAEIRVMNLINWIVWRAWFTLDACQRQSAFPREAAAANRKKELLIRGWVAKVSAGSVEKTDAGSGDAYR